MKILLILAVLLLGWQTGVCSDMSGLINKYAEMYNVDPQIVLAVVNVESRFHPGVVSADGSYGLMQLLPSTARVLGYQGPIKGLKNPETNIRLGVFYLSYLKDKFDSMCDVLDAYNRGWASVQKWPYKGDWHKHRYVGRILQYIDNIQDTDLKNCIDEHRNIRDQRYRKVAEPRPMLSYPDFDEVG